VREQILDQPPPSLLFIARSSFALVRLALLPSFFHLARVGEALPADTLNHKHHVVVLLISSTLHRTLLDRGGGVIVAPYVCIARRRRPLWCLDRIGSRGGDASTTMPTTFI
jgi:hypothetical protein